MTAATMTAPLRKFGLKGLVASVEQKLRQRRVYNQTVRELHSLTDRELSDLGIPRGMIHQIAHDGAYGERA